MSSLSEVPSDAAAALLLLGENHAFALVAGRCSAAQAVGIRRMREEKLYKPLSSDWREFCPTYLKMSASNADRIIRLLEEFGLGYFEVAQLTRISPETYRAIEPAVKDGALHANGEAIELHPENARKVAAAIAELRKTAAPKKKRQPQQIEAHEKLALIDKRFTTLIAELEELSRKEQSGENWLQLTATITRLRAALTRLEVQNGL